MACFSACYRIIVLSFCRASIFYRKSYNVNKKIPAGRFAGGIL